MIIFNLFNQSESSVFSTQINALLMESHSYAAINVKVTRGISFPFFHSRFKEIWPDEIV